MGPSVRRSGLARAAASEGAAGAGLPLGNVLVLAAPAARGMQVVRPEPLTRRRHEAPRPAHAPRLLLVRARIPAAWAVRPAGAAAAAVVAFSCPAGRPLPAGTRRGGRRGRLPALLSPRRTRPDSAARSVVRFVSSWAVGYPIVRAIKTALPSRSLLLMPLSHRCGSWHGPTSPSTAASPPLRRPASAAAGASVAAPVRGLLRWAAKRSPGPYMAPVRPHGYRPPPSGSRSARRAVRPRRWTPARKLPPTWPRRNRDSLGDLVGR